MRRHKPPRVTKIDIQETVRVVVPSDGEVYVRIADVVSILGQAADKIEADDGPHAAAALLRSFALMFTDEDRKARDTLRQQREQAATR